MKLKTIGMNKKILDKKYAVILIHGIGEQKQMETIKGFVKSIVGENFIHSPYKLTESYEINKLSYYSKSKKIRTDFFEYYWANNFRDTKYSQVFSWLKYLNSNKNLPVKLVGPKLLIDFLQIYFRIGLLVIISNFIFSKENNINLELVNNVFGYGSIVLSIITFFVGKLILNTAGDAARYLNNSPDNINGRNNVRINGIKVLKDIHDEKDENGNALYEKVIIVGHSLGSIIGYEIINNLWAQYYKEIILGDNESIKPNIPIKEFNYLSGKLTKLNKYESKEEMVIHEGITGKVITAIELFIAIKIKKSIKPNYLQLCDEELTKEYHKIQAKIQKQPEINRIWRISDFITLGSPLHYSEIILARNKDDWFDRVYQKEMPICPPVVSDPNRRSSDIAFYEAIYYDENKKTRFHHSAAFSVVKWSNIFFRGDLIAGEINHLFGQGVMEYEASLFEKKKALHFSPNSHTKYWDATDNVNNEALFRLKTLLDI